jgi:hypothetical protein
MGCSWGLGLSERCLVRGWVREWGLVGVDRVLTVGLRYDTHNGFRV